MILLVWVHLLGAIVWIGGMIFLSFILVPVFKRGSFGADRRMLFQTLARRFRVAVWLSIIALLTTGPVLLVSRTGHLLDPSKWPFELLLKLVLVAVLIGFTAMHDFWLGPMVGRIRRESSGTPSTGDQVLISLSAWVARLMLLLALAIVYLGLVVART